MALTDMVKKFFAASAFSLALYASGCGGGEETRGCRTDYDCREDRICHREGYCYDPGNPGRDGGNTDAGDSELEGRIVFISLRDTDVPRIWAMNADGSNPQPLTPDWVVDFGYLTPAWSPDGQRIAYHRGRGIGILLSDGSTTVVGYCCDNFNPAWSPDGQEIAYARNGAASGDPTNNSLYIDNLISNYHRMITSVEWKAAPTWSPDGGKIAYERDSGIYLVNIDGSDPRELFHTSSFPNAPAWSPDGQKIAFSAQLDGENWDIYVMNADGSNVINVTNHPAQDKNPAWSPDGRRIAFDSDRNGSMDTEIYIMNADGSNPINITNSRNDDEQPAWTQYSIDFHTY